MPVTTASSRMLHYTFRAVHNTVAFQQRIGYPWYTALWRAGSRDSLSSTARSAGRRLAHLTSQSMCLRGQAAHVRIVDTCDNMSIATLPSCTSSTFAFTAHTHGSTPRLHPFCPGCSGNATAAFYVRLQLWAACSHVPSTPLRRRRGFRR